MSEGEFFINSAKSMPLDDARKLLLQPNSSSNVRMPSPLSDRGPDRDNWSSAVKSNGFIVFILLPPNSSSNVCMLSPLSKRDPDRDRWSSTVKSNGLIVFISVDAEVELGGEGSANDM